jgi:hypothetical protein
MCSIKLHRGVTDIIDRSRKNVYGEEMMLRKKGEMWQLGIWCKSLKRKVDWA